ncbi:MAG: tRNA pseudouridine(38-40) synthase TruA [Kiritimatiellia bacterium]|jgi:tRNA pseudouridine38-40 synthase
MRYRILIAYDGTDFHGWQIQPGFRTVQQELGEALAPLSHDGQPVKVHGSGRTDAGVHADGQVAHFDLERVMAPHQLRRAINGRLPNRDVRVLAAEPVADDFDARRWAVGKEYRYRIWNAEVLHPLRRRDCAHVIKPIDLEAMRAGAGRFVGEHDFAAFTVNPSREIESTVREVFGIEVVQDGELIELRVSGNGFLYKMVRSIAGFLVAVGTSRESPSAVTDVMDSRIRTARVESAPPQGLVLWRVWYE